MRNLYTILLLPIILLGWLFVLSSNANSKVPTPKIESFTKKYTIIPNNTELIYNLRLFQKYQASFDSLQQTIRRNVHDGEQKLTISFSRIQDPIPVEEKQRHHLDRPEAYLLVISSKHIQVMSQDDQGLLNGLTTLESLVDQNKGKIPQGWIIDFPDTNLRILHISLWPCTIQDFKESIKLARFGHYNGLILLNNYGVDLHSLKQLHIVDKQKWSTNDFQKMVIFAQENGLEVIPELKLLSHQEKFINDRHPQYMYNVYTYDPRIIELYKKIVFPAIDELLLLTSANKFHIGHDEVYGVNQKDFRKTSAKRLSHLPPELFLQDVLILHDYLKNKGIETWMWGDMLLSREEFPGTKDSEVDLNGDNGYAALRNKIPKDIVICDWHYQSKQISFPTALAFAQAGHKVLGATWQVQETTKNFSKYIGQLAHNGEGMIATTWYGLSGEKKDEVRTIIRSSGETFWNTTR